MMKGLDICTSPPERGTNLRSLPKWRPLCQAKVLEFLGRSYGYCLLFVYWHGLLFFPTHSIQSVLSSICLKVLIILFMV
jgi:hypothetical protein